MTVTRHGVATVVDTQTKRKGKSLAFWLALLVLLTAVTTAWLWPRGEGVPNDPNNPGPTGTKAVAKVLGQQGVHVQRVRKSADLAGIKPTSDATLVVSASKGWHSDASLSRVAEVKDRYQRIVLIGVQPYSLSRFGMKLSRSGQASGRLKAECSSKVIGQAKVAEPRGKYSYGYVDTSGSLEGCFRVGTVSTSSVVPWLVVASTGPGTQIIAVSDASVFTNEHVLASDNGALALTLLGRHSHLVWLNYDPSADQQATSDPDPQGVWSVLPRWVQTVQLMLTWTALAALLWQVRRFGRLVTEPLPVVVKAVETTVSRGHLHEKARAREHALEALQEGTRHRLCRRLALPVTAPAEQLVDAVASATGRPTAQLSWLLFDSAVGTDEDLVARTRGLTQLEEEIRTS